MKNKVIAAEKSDSPQMLEIIESSGAKGSFEMLYTRRPDPFASYLKESGRVRIGVCKSGECVEYQGVSVWDRHFINGRVMGASYITGIKKRQDCRAFNLKQMAQYLSFEDTDIFFFSFLNSNEYGKNVFFKSRKYMPELVKICDYRTFIFNPKQLAGKPPGKPAEKLSDSCKFRRMNREDTSTVADFLNEQGRNFNFAVEIDDITARFSGLGIENCFILEDDGKIAAFAALWDRTADKQYIVKKYSFPMKLLKSIPKLTEAFGYISLPDEGEVFKFPIISFMYSRDNDPGYYEIMLGKICSAIGGEYSIVVAGTDTRDPNVRFYDRIKKISFDSSICYLSYNPDLKVDKDMLTRVECALL